MLHQIFRVYTKVWGKDRFLVSGLDCLTALSDHTQAVVVKVSEAVSTALDEFHFSVEALGD